MQGLEKVLCTAMVQIARTLRGFVSRAFLLPLPTTQEWGEDRGEGRPPPLPSPPRPDGGEGVFGCGFAALGWVGKNLRRIWWAPSAGNCSASSPASSGDVSSPVVRTGRGRPMNAQPRRLRHAKMILCSSNEEDEAAVGELAALTALFPPASVERLQ